MVRKQQVDTIPPSSGHPMSRSPSITTSLAMVELVAMMVVEAMAVVVVVVVHAR